jgi:hypothetical protein
VRNLGQDKQVVVVTDQQLEQHQRLMAANERAA